jgi:uncharacterized protein
MATHQTLLLDGAAGALEVAISAPEAATGIAVVGHPHPLFGGTMTNKVVTTIARTLVDAGYATARFNFRGVGKSAGVHDEGRGETDDFLQIVSHLQAQVGALPLVLAGFSFGGAVALHASEQVAASGMLLAAPAFKRLPALGSQGGKPPSNTLVLHGDADTTVPLAESFAWATPRDVPVLVIPGADHFFHARLHHVKLATRLVATQWIEAGSATT